jgi:hypothetical protein
MNPTMESNWNVPKKTDGWGWSDFLIRNKKDKAKYVASLIMQNMQSGGLPEEYAVFATNGFLGNILSQKYPDEYYYGIDHQSVINLPFKHQGPSEKYKWSNTKGEIFKINLEFAKEFFDYIVNNKNIAIAGGNDNSDEFDYGGEKLLTNMGRDASRDSVYTIAKKDGDYWTIYNTKDGTKIRLSFIDNAPPYEKSTTPELIDVKLTNFCAYGCDFCFVPGTLIFTPNGEVPIEDIKKNDLVYAYDLDKNKKVEVSAEQTFERDYDGKIIDIVSEDGTTISLTPEHEVFTKNRDWVLARNLVEGDEVLKSDRPMKISKISRRHYKGKVHNIGTPPLHNYIANNILVHNCYQDSTINGKHASFDQVKQIFYTLSKLEVFEVALGGGETTTHPEFDKILQEAYFAGLTPNFTSFNMEWAKKKNVEEAVLKYCGGFAISLAEDRSKNTKKIKSVTNWLKKNKSFSGKVQFQLIIGLMDEKNLLETINEIGKNDHGLGNNYGITLLGYKTFGRGINLLQNVHKINIKNVIDCARVNWVKIGLDTKAVQNHKDELAEANISSLLTTDKEGVFSMYIDAVENTISKDSYSKESFGFDFETTWDRKYYNVPNDSHLEKVILKNFPFA